MKFHVRTYGCQMNVRDSEAVEALLVALTLWSFWTYTHAYLPSLTMALARK